MPRKTKTSFLDAIPLLRKMADRAAIAKLLNSPKPHKGQTAVSEKPEKM